MWRERPSPFHAGTGATTALLLPKIRTTQMLTSYIRYSGTHTTPSHTPWPSARRDRYARSGASQRRSRDQWKNSRPLPSRCRYSLSHAVLYRQEANEGSRIRLVPRIPVARPSHRPAPRGRAVVQSGSRRPGSLGRPRGHAHSERRRPHRPHSSDRWGCREWWSCGEPPVTTAGRLTDRGSSIVEICVICG